MGSPREQHVDKHQFSFEDDLGRLIRWSLKDSASNAEPSAKVWPQILDRVRTMNMPAKTEPWLKRNLVPLAPLLQAAVLSALLLAFGLGVDHDPVILRMSYRERPTPTLQKVTIQAERSEDMLRGYLLVRSHAEPLLHNEGRIPDLRIPE
jgi:hypothetical protein